jgi:hypothetical protein
MVPKSETTHTGDYGQMLKRLQHAFHEKLSGLKTTLHGFTPWVLLACFPRRRGELEHCTLLHTVMVLRAPTPRYIQTSFLCLLGLLFDSEDGGSIFLQNIHKLLSGYMAYFPMRPFSSIRSVTMDITSSCTGLDSIAELTLLYKYNYYNEAGLKYIKICIENICTVFY